MKRIFKYMMVLTAAFALAACTEDIENPVEKPDDEKPEPKPEVPKLDDEITISAAINNAGTKVGFADNTIVVSWNGSGEAFVASIEGTPVVFSQTTAPDADGKADFLGNPSDDATHESMLYAVYPAVEGTTVSLDLSKQTGKDLDPSLVYLYGSGKVSEILETGLVFNHAVASVKATLAFSDVQGAALAAGTAKNVTVTAEGLVSAATCDLSKMQLDVTPAASGSMTFSGEFALDAEGKAEVNFIVLPGQLGDITVSAEIDGRTYTAALPAVKVEAGQAYALPVACQEVLPMDFYVTASGSASGLSWETPASLTTALETAPAGATIHLAAGTYVPEKSLTLSQEFTGEEAKGFEILKPLTVVGGYPANPSAGSVADPSANATILDGQGKSFHVLFVAVPKNAGEVVLKGLTVKGGNATGADANIKHKMVNDNGEEHDVTIGANYGGGIAAMSSVLKLENVNIIENKGASAAAVFALNTDLEMKGCAVEDNSSVTSDNYMGVVCKANANYAINVSLDDCTLRRNISEKDRNNGALCLLVDKGTFKSLTVKNCTFEANKVKNGTDIYANSVENVIISGSSFKKGYSDGGSGSVFFESKTGNTSVYVENSVWEANECGGNGTAITADTNGGGNFDIHLVNCAFVNNKAGQRGPIFLRSRAKEGGLNAKIVNCTFEGNHDGTCSGSAICLGEDKTPLNVDVISCTVVRNKANRTKDATERGAIGMQGSTNTKLNIYNSIVSGNTFRDTEVDDIFVMGSNTPTIVYHSSIIGDKYYNADGAETSVTPVFDYNTMIGALAQTGNTWTCKLVGDASSNPAFGNGSTLAELGKLADATVTADILKKDQAGNARTDSDKVIGAFIK